MENANNIAGQSKIIVLDEVNLGFGVALIHLFTATENTAMITKTETMVEIKRTDDEITSLRSGASTFFQSNLQTGLQACCARNRSNPFFPICH